MVDISGTTERCRVLLRLKPSKDDEACPIIVEGNSIKVRKESYNREYCGDDFSFDHIFRPETSQEELFQSVLQDSIEPVLNGFNATLLAFGQTGSGKTYTMFGEGDRPEERGIIPRALEQIFDKIANDTSGGVFVVKAAMIEIYKEELKDLLRPNEGKLRLRESVFDGVWVEGLHWIFVASAHAALSLLLNGMVARSIGVTQMNEKSSRSHCIFLLRVEFQGPNGIVQRGTLHFADLAGLERVDRTGAQGQTLEEAKKINLSLSALGNCIHALSQPGRLHIPFRDSKLTFLLKNSLGGNAKTTLLIAASTRSKDVDESLGAFKFGARARSIKNIVKVNQKLRSAPLCFFQSSKLNEFEGIFEEKLGAEELERLFNKLKQEHDALQHYCHSLEQRLAALSGTAAAPGPGAMQDDKENALTHPSHSGSARKAPAGSVGRNNKGPALAPADRNNLNVLLQRRSVDTTYDESVISDRSFFSPPPAAVKPAATTPAAVSGGGGGDPQSMSAICNRWRRATVDGCGVGGLASPVRNLDPVRLLQRITELESANVDMQIELESLIMQREAAPDAAAGAVGVVRTSLPAPAEPMDHHDQDGPPESTDSTGSIQRAQRRDSAIATSNSPAHALTSPTDLYPATPTTGMRAWAADGAHPPAAVMADAASSPHCALPSPLPAAAAAGGSGRVTVQDGCTGPRTPMPTAEAAIQAPSSARSPAAAAEFDKDATMTNVYAQTSPWRWPPSPASQDAPRLPGIEDDLPAGVLFGDGGGKTEGEGGGAIEQGEAGGGAVKHGEEGLGAVKHGEEGGAVKHGELLKKRRWIGGFRRVEVWLREASIVLSSGREGVRKEISLAYVSSVASVDRREHKDGTAEFVVRFGGRENVFAAASRDDREDWVRKIRARLGS